MISKWIIKAVVQKVISYLPASQKINYFFQKNVTGGVHLTDEHFDLKIGHARDHFCYLMESEGRQEDRTILELGTGWYPVIPILFYLTGSGRVVSVDIQQWMTCQTQLNTIRKFREWKERGLLDDLLDVIDQERWQLLMKLLGKPWACNREEINSLIGLTPLVGDAGNLSLEKESVDFICSNNTFEHIPGEVLKAILLEFKRVLQPAGVMSHFIDMSDHFAHFDSRISIYNFLKFSKKRWRILDNTIQPQNRMRHRDYLEMYRETGLPVSLEETREGSLEDLRKVKIHPEFSAYSPEELAISHAYIISRNSSLMM
ncbi:MAG: class I SAM-dependent methyltransferase [Bacteroidetes bacterium]|nr:class I SAM-dependent methyltransferase [Bacteroidota bacterium]